VKHITRDFVCYVDGSANQYSGSAGIGGKIVEPATDTVIEFSRKLKVQATSNMAELAAIKFALKAIEEPGNARILIYTDSEYAVGVLTGVYKKITQNQALINSIKKDMALFGECSIKWQKGHVGHKGNEKADTLAKSAHIVKGNQKSIFDPFYVALAVSDGVMEVVGVADRPKADGRRWEMVQA
jgi:ribonuclease HI